MVIEYECKKCKEVYSYEEHEKDRFCKKCGTHLYLKVLYKKKTTGPTVQDIKKNDINVEALFHSFTTQRNPDIGAGLSYRTIADWMAARKKAYLFYQEKFHPSNLQDLAKVARDYKQWVLGKNNKSWTNYQRKGYLPAKTPLRLVKTLTFIQDESLPIEHRVYESLKGKHYLEGMGQGILTSLLHTLFPTKYGVWNSRTRDTLTILRRKPFGEYSSYVGESYVEVNKALHELKDELKTDLTYVDGFMWFVSKHVRFID